MSQATETESPVLSLTEGGPFVRLERHIRLVERDGRRGARHVLGVPTPVWAVMMVLAIVGVLLEGRIDLEPVLWQIDVHARLLVATPLLLLSEIVMEARAAELTRRATSEGCVEPAGLSRWHATIAQLHRLRDAWWPELVIVFVVYAMTAAGLLRIFPEQVARWLVPSLHPERALEHAQSVAWWLYVLIGQPIFLFLAFRWLWRWALWSALLVSLPWMHLDLQASHPDRAGGIGFLSGLLMPLRWFVVAIGVALVSVWMDEILWERAPSSEFAGYFLGFVAFVLFIALAPHLAMTPQLMRSRRWGATEYAKLVRQYIEQFDQRWIAEDKPPLLGHPDFSGLADIGSSYGVIRQMRVTLFSRTDVLILVGLLLALIAPLVLVGLSPADIVKMFVERITGV